MTQDSGVSDVRVAAISVVLGPTPAIKRECPCAKLAGDRLDQTAGQRICGSGEAGRRSAGSRSRRQRNPHAHASPGAGRARPVARDGLHLPQIAAFPAAGGPGRPFPEARQASDTVIEARLLSSFGRPNRQTRLEGAFRGNALPFITERLLSSGTVGLNRSPAFSPAPLALRPVVTERLPLHQLRPLGLNPLPFPEPMFLVRLAPKATRSWRGNR